jgi:hypothetical protein
MDQYLLIPFLGEWTSIYQLFWCSPGVQGFDTLPYISMRCARFAHHFAPIRDHRRRLGHGLLIWLTSALTTTMSRLMKKNINKTREIGWNMNFCHIGLKGSSRCRDLLEGIINLVFVDINRESLDDWANSDSPWQTHPEVHRHFPSRCSLPLG